MVAISGSGRHCFVEVFLDKYVEDVSYVVVIAENDAYT